MVEIRCAELDMAAIADSGQCFRLTEEEPGRYALVALGRALSIERAGDGWRFGCSQAEFDAVWRGYFDLDTDYGALRALIDPQDAYLTRAAAFGAGIRMLRQDPWETLAAFIISQRKSIPAIRHCIEALSACYGEPVSGAEGRRAFPSAERLAALEPDGFAVCSLGYRGKYLSAAAQMAASGQLDLASLNALPDEAAASALRAVPGVGEKVADCVLLFGYHRLSRFPRDVWINRVLEREYPAGFPAERYAGCEGVMQQYLFYYARRGERAG